jgi:hypothetical protein
MEDVPFVPLYNLADLYGVARNVVWRARPDEKIFTWETKIKSRSKATEVCRVFPKFSLPCYISSSTSV